jgi:hypothetical protein
VDLYIHSPIRLHGIVLNKLSTGTTLPFTFYTNSAPSLQKTHCVSFKLLMLFREIIAFIQKIILSHKFTVLIEYRVYNVINVGTCTNHCA